MPRRFATNDTEYRFRPDAPDPMTQLVANSGMTLLELAERCGYRDLAKGVLHLQCFLRGDRRKYRHMRTVVSAALGMAPEALDAIGDDAAYWRCTQREREYRKNFQPHVVWKTERHTPSPIFIAAMLGSSRPLKFWPASTDADAMAREALAAMPSFIPAFGRVLGFHVNVSLEESVEYDCLGRLVAKANGVVRTGKSELHLRRRQIEFDDARIDIVEES